MVVSQGPLQRDPPMCPLLLRIEGIAANRLPDVEAVDVERDLIGNGIIDPVLQVLQVPEVLPLIDQQRALIANLDAVTPGDEGRAHVPLVVPVDVRGPVQRPVRQSGDVAVTGAAAGALLDHADQILGLEAGKLPAAVPAAVHAEPGFQQEPIAHRRGPLRLRHAVAEIAVACRLGRSKRGRRGGRGCRRSGEDLVVPRFAAGIARESRRGTPFAGELLVVEHRELVSRRGLRGQPERGNAKGGGEHGRAARVGNVRPLRGVARVGIREHARHCPFAPFFAQVQVVPQAVPRDGPADAEVEVPHFPGLARRRQAAVAQLLRVVAADHAARDPGGEERASHRVAAFFRQHVQRRTAAFSFAEAAGGGHRDLARVRHVGDVRRHARAVERGADAEAIHVDATLVGPPAESPEHHHAGHHLDVRRRTSLVDAVGDQLDQVVVRPRGGNRADHLVVEHHLPAHVLHIDDGRLPGDGDGLGELADAHVGVDGCGEGPFKGDALPLDRAESRQGERDRVLSRPKIDDAVLTVAVGRGAPHLFNERWA